MSNDFNDFLAYLLRQSVGHGTETAELAAYIGKLDVEYFENEQALKEVEDEQDRQSE